MKKIIQIAIILINTSIFGQGVINLNSGSNEILTNVNNKTEGWVTPEMFGATGDGVTNDSAAWQRMINYCESNNKNIICGKEIIYNISGALTCNTSLKIDGNNSTLLFTYDGAQTISNRFFAFSVQGTHGITYVNNNGAYKSSDRMVVSNSTLLSQLDTGSYVKIFTNRPFQELGGDGRKQGEMKIVRNIQGNVVQFTENFYDTYDTIDTVQIFIAEPVNFVCENLNMIGNSKEWGIGFNLQITKNVVIEDCQFDNFYYASVYSVDGYNAYFRYKSVNNIQSSAGYGLAIIGASMNNKASLNVHVCRHPVTWNGIEGIPWNSIIYNTYASNIFGGSAFASHSNVGSLTIQDTELWGGLRDTINYKYEYSADSTYSDGDVVSYKGMLMESVIDNNIGNAIDTNIVTRWKMYDNNTAAFYLTNPYITIRNCKAYNFSELIAITDVGVYDCIVDGIHGYNCNTGIDVQNNIRADRCLFDNIYITNSVMKNNTYLARFIGDTLYDFKFGKLSGININGMYFSEIYGDDIVVDDLSHNQYGIQFGGQSDVSLSVQVKSLKSIKGLTGQCIRTESTTNLERIRIDNFVLENFRGTAISINGNVEYLDLGKVTASCGDDPQIFISANGLNNLINYSFVSDSTDQYYYCSGSQQIKRAYVGTATGYFWNDYPFAGTATPAIEVINGNLYAPLLSRGNGSPEGVLSARPGAMYLRKDGGTDTVLYIKEGAGYNSTGWSAK